MYRIVHCRMWRRGGSFRNLSGPATPNAQHLWLYLLTGDSTIAIPGVIPTTREGLASHLDWKANATFDRCIAEITAAKMAIIDWKAGLIWCPSAFRYNKPQSPNVVRSWGKAYDVLPECKLKTTIRKAIKSFCSDLGEAFDKAFEEGFPEALPKGFLFPDPDPDPDPVPAKASKKRVAAVDGFDDFWLVYPRKTGKGDARLAWARARREGRLISILDMGKRAVVDGQITLVELNEHLVERSAKDRQWLKDDGEFIPNPSTFLNQSRWLDQWKPIRSKHAGVHIDDPTWEYETYRKADAKKHHDHEHWLEYVSAMADLPPRTAPPFEEWLKNRGGA